MVKPVWLVVLVVVALLGAEGIARAAAPCDPQDPRACLLPYPNDAFTVRDASTDTGRRLALPRSGMPRNVKGVPVDPTDLNRNDGFSPGSTIITQVPGLDLARTRAVPVTDLQRAFDRRAPIVLIDARTRRRQPIWAELDTRATRVRDRALLIHPARNLLDGHRYIVALRTLRDAQGRVLAPQPVFQALAGTGRIRSRALARRRAHTRDLLRTLRRAGIGSRGLYLAWDFTVASERNLSERLLSMRNDAIRQLGDTDLGDRRVEGRPPAFKVDQVEELAPCGADGCQAGEDDRLLRRVTGTVEVPCYLDQAGCPPGARMRFAGPGSARPAQLPGNVSRAPFQCIVPRVAQTRPARLSLYGHGLLGRHTEVGAGNVRDMAAEHDFVFCATDEIGMARDDVTNAVGILQDFSKFGSLADRLQQGLLNGLYLGRLLLHPQGLAAHPAFAGLLDTSALFYDGNSQGGIFGGALTAVAPDFTRSVLGVPGMNYSVLLPRSVDFDTYAQVFDPAYPNPLDRAQILAMIQGLWDRGEANGYANHMTSDPLPGTPRHTVLLHVALGDHQVAPITAENEARTIGARVHQPAYAPGRTADRRPLFGLKALRPDDPGSGLVIWDSGSPVPPTTATPPRAGRDPHEDPRHTPAARQQKSEFLRPDGRIVDTCAGQPCRAVQAP